MNKKLLLSSFQLYRKSVKINKQKIYFSQTLRIFVIIFKKCKIITQKFEKEHVVLYTTLLKDLQVSL